MKKLATYLLCLFAFSQLASCQNKNEKNMTTEIYDWQDATSCPLSYPIEVYRGGLQNLKKGSYTSLSAGMTIGKGNWGAASYGMGSGVKPLPDHLNVVYLSYAEDKFFQVDCDLDYEKIASLFRNGYDIKATSGSGKTRHENFDTIIVGFAPGGVCVVWIAGSGRQAEIGRYQGKEVVIPQKEIDGLDSHNHLLFEPEYRKKMMKNTNIVPLAVQGKTISYGLWDTYRKRYNWKPVFELQNGAVLEKNGEYGADYFNGESEYIFFENFSEIDNRFTIQNYLSNALPRVISFSWITSEKKLMSGNCHFNEDSIFSAFKEVYGERPESITADLDIRVNMSDTFFTVKLKGNGKDIFIKTENVEIFEVK